MKKQGLTRFMDVLVTLAGVSIMAYLLIAPTYYVGGSRGWIGLELGAIIFSLNIFIAICGVKSIMGKGEAEEMELGLAMSMISIWVFSLFSFFCGIEDGLFIMHIASYGWIWGFTLVVRQYIKREDKK
jgi:hypothetical protein